METKRERRLFEIRSMSKAASVTGQIVIEPTRGLRKLPKTTAVEKKEIRKTKSVIEIGITRQVTEMLVACKNSYDRIVFYRRRSSSNETIGTLYNSVST